MLQSCCHNSTAIVKVEAGLFDKHSTSAGWLPWRHLYQAHCPELQINLTGSYSNIFHHHHLLLLSQEANACFAIPGRVES